MEQGQDFRQIALAALDKGELGPAQLFESVVREAKLGINNVTFTLAHLFSLMEKLKSERLVNEWYTGEGESKSVVFLLTAKGHQQVAAARVH